MDNYNFGRLKIIWSNVLDRKIFNHIFYLFLDN